MKYFLIYFTLLILTIACQPVTGIETESVLTPSSMTTQQSPESPVSPSSNLDHLTQIAVENLAQHLELNPHLVNIIQVQTVTWPDASLGCPQLGMMYAQVTTPGYWILLEASGEQYPYHTDQGEHVILCQENDLPSFPVTPGEIQDGKPWMPVQ